MDDDQLRLLTKVARLYHEQGLRQPQIATKLRISQPRVSRLLKQALTKGIVRTVVPRRACTPISRTRPSAVSGSTRCDPALRMLGGELGQRGGEETAVGPLDAALAAQQCALCANIRALWAPSMVASGIQQHGGQPDGHGVQSGHRDRGGDPCR